MQNIFVSKSQIKNFQNLEVLLDLCNKDNPLIENAEDEITKCPYCLAKYHAKNLDCLTEKIPENIYHSPLQSYQKQQYIMPVLSTQNISEIGKVKLGKIKF